MGNNNSKWLCEKFGTNPEPESAPNRRPEAVTYKKENDMLEVKVKKLREDVCSLAFPDVLTLSNISFSLTVSGAIVIVFSFHILPICDGVPPNPALIVVCDPTLLIM